VCLLGLNECADPNAEQIYKYAQVLTATLACDHRVIDGAVGAQWLSVFKELVEDPLKMIL
jgi:pyruvate dehydrogenase E2 component (dihydrolipoamide acetyltransferase)